MSIIIGGDVCPTEKNRELFIKGDAEALFGKELVDKLREADLRVVNLETPLCDSDSPIKKCGPALRAPEGCVKGLKAIGADIVSLANNHVMDQGEKGLYATMGALRENDVRFLGAGANRKSAMEPLFADVNGVRFGFFSCTEHEFSTPESEEAPGAAPFDPLVSLDAVLDARNKCDRLIVFYHSGKELYPYPSPGQQRICRRLVDKGASLVLCQHSHCIGCEERYGGATILYGQGNFLLDCGDEECKKSGLLVKVGDDLNVDYIPVVKRGAAVRLAEGAERESILKAFRARSEEIKREGAVEELYTDFAEGKLTELLGDLNGRESLPFKVLNKLSGNRLRSARLLRRYPEYNMLCLLNRIECEDWRELILKALRSRLGK